MTHILDSWLLYVHPPIAIVGYVFVILNVFLTHRYLQDEGYKRMLEVGSLLAWGLTLGGLVTGMIWAELAWGTYWSWDPKETATLVLFMLVSLHLFIFYRDNDNEKKYLFWLAVGGAASIGLVVMSPFIAMSLHAYA